MAKADTVRSPFDQAWNICQYESRPRAQIDNAETGMQGGEGIIRNLGLGRSGPAQKRRFSGIGQAEKPRICD